jgi:hypothetical protein
MGRGLDGRQSVGFLVVKVGLCCLPVSEVTNGRFPPRASWDEFVDRVCMKKILIKPSANSCLIQVFELGLPLWR